MMLRSAYEFTKASDSSDSCIMSVWTMWALDAAILQRLMRVRGRLGGR